MVGAVTVGGAGEAGADVGASSASIEAEAEGAGGVGVSVEPALFLLRVLGRRGIFGWWKLRERRGD